MKPRLFTRVVASLLALVGLYWAMMLILTLFVPPVGIIFNLLYLPGWLCFIGWCQILGAHQMLVSRMTFWLFSGTAHIYLALITPVNGHLGPSGESVTTGFITGANWCILVSIVSYVCAYLEYKQTKMNKTENKPAHPTAGNVLL